MSVASELWWTLGRHLPERGPHSRSSPDKPPAGWGDWGLLFETHYEPRAFDLCYCRYAWPSDSHHSNCLTWSLHLRETLTTAKFPSRWLGQPFRGDATELWKSQLSSVQVIAPSELSYDVGVSGFRQLQWFPVRVWYSPSESCSRKEEVKSRPVWENKVLRHNSSIGVVCSESFGERLQLLRFHLPIWRLLGNRCLRSGLSESGLWEEMSGPVVSQVLAEKCRWQDVTPCPSINPWLPAFSKVDTLTAFCFKMSDQGHKSGQKPGPKPISL